MSINVNYTDYPNEFDTVTVTDPVDAVMVLDITAGTPDVLNFKITESGGLVQTLSIEKEEVRDVMLLLQRYIAMMDIV